MRLAETGPESPYPFWIMGDEQTVAETRLYLLAAALGAVTENSTSPQEGVESAQLVMNTNTGEPPRDRQAARQLLLRTLANTMRAEDFLWQPPKDHEATRLDTEFFILNEEGLVRSSNNMEPVIEHITPFTLTDGWPAAILGGEGGDISGTETEEAGEGGELMLTHFKLNLPLMRAERPICIRKMSTWRTDVSTSGASFIRSL